MDKKNPYDMPKEFGEIPREYYVVEVPKLEISEDIRQAIRESGLSLRRTAEKTKGLSYSQIARITAGENYTIDTLLKVLDVLDLRIKIEKRK